MGKIDGGLRSEFRKYLLGFDWVSIESGSTGAGIPDSNFCRGGVEGWVEFKLTPGWTCPLEPEQVGWIARRVRCGGRVWIAVRRRAAAGPRRGAEADQLWVIPGRLAARAKAGGLRGLCATGACPEAYMWAGGPARWDWRAVAALLAS